MRAGGLGRKNISSATKAKPKEIEAISIFRIMPGTYPAQRRIGVFMADFLVRTPDHLGDGVMALPAIEAIAKVGTVQLVGPSWVERLYAGIHDNRIGQPDTAILFKPSFSAAWKVRHLRRRVGHRGHHRRWLLTEALIPSDGHRMDGYAALARAVDATVHGPPSFNTTEQERAAVHDIPENSVLLLPLSKSQRTVGWQHFRRLADNLSGRAIFAAGPGECETLKTIAGPHMTLPPLDIGTFAAVAQRVDHVVGNDSGLAHLAAAARHAFERDPRTVHVIFGSTSPTHTGPFGCTPHQTAQLACQPCYKKRCNIAAQPPCLDVPVSAIEEALA